MADQISDAILDSMIKDDPNSHVAVETLITTGQVHVAGEVTTETYVDIPGSSGRRSLEIGTLPQRYDGASCACPSSGPSPRISPRGVRERSAP
jgi:S-adenosylmethionine synthetase